MWKGVHGIEESELHLICDVGILHDVTLITQSLPHMLGEEILVDFDIPYLTFPDTNSCDFLLGVDYQDLMWLPGP